ncbi:hypothetical protein [Nostoc sp.]|uniref:hypothetical protein n=1 Tax=Nostoc sp. TaxID=1180 RepID=UPI002FF82D88
MISQHLQTATLVLSVSRQQLTEGITFHAIAELQDFIAFNVGRFKRLCIGICFNTSRIRVESS